MSEGDIVKGLVEEHQLFCSMLEEGLWRPRRMKEMEMVRGSELAIVRRDCYN